MNIKFFGIKDCGKKYDHNEDFISLPQTDNNIVDNKSMSLFVLCDGMGGGNAGEVASQLSATWLQNDFANSIKDSNTIFKKIFKSVSKRFEEINEIIYNHIQEINQKIYNLAQEHEQYENMATTLLALFIQNENLLIHSVGDSRCYRFRNEEMIQLTEDQSEVWKLYKMGAISKEEMRNHPRNNIITSAIGSSKRVIINQYKYKILKNDIYLMCSDGLSDMISDNEIKECLLSENNLEQIGNLLVKRANEAGGKDNISLILIKIQ